MAFNGADNRNVETTNLCANVVCIRGFFPIITDCPLLMILDAFMTKFHLETLTFLHFDTASKQIIMWFIIQNEL